jgi:nitrate/nitrite transport system ATP-binding protein
MVSNLKAGNIDGYCVGEPWNSRAVNEGHGFVVATDLDLFPGHIEKVLGVREEWANKYPQTHLALVKALLEACQYCDDPRNREEIVGLLAQDQYVGSSLEDIRPGFIDAYDRGTSAPPQMLQRYNQFFVDRTNYPERVEILWVLTQMARWGLTPFPKNWLSIIERVRRADLFGEAARQLELPDMGRDRGPIKLFDGTVFDPNDPIGYLNNLEIKRQIRIEEIDIDAVAMPVA